MNNAQASFHSVDILADEALRQGVKAYSDWPTFPQLYIKGELVGGCDIVTEMSVSETIYLFGLVMNSFSEC